MPRFCNSTTLHTLLARLHIDADALSISDLAGSTADRLDEPVPISPDGMITMSAGIQTAIRAADIAIFLNGAGEGQRRTGLLAMDNKLNKAAGGNRAGERTIATERWANAKISLNMLLLLSNPVKGHRGIDIAVIVMNCPIIGGGQRGISGRRR